MNVDNLVAANSSSATMSTTMLSSNNSAVLKEVFDVDNDALVDQYYHSDYIDACNMVIMITLQTSPKYQNQRFHYLAHVSCCWRLMRHMQMQYHAVNTLPPSMF